jgi:hypothetical protein
MEWFWNGFLATLGYGVANILIPIAILGVLFMVVYIHHLITGR